MALFSLGSFRKMVKVIHPVGGAFAGELVSQIAWRPDDCALAAVNATGGITVWDFKMRTKKSPKGFS
jgi:hypothetical protein